MSKGAIQVNAEDMVAQARKARYVYLANQDLNWLDLCVRIATFCGVRLTPEEVAWIMWNETGYPTFFQGDILEQLSIQFAQALERIRVAWRLP